MYKKLLTKNLLCTGCGACINTCKNHAIKYFYDNENDGSILAKIDSEKCISCMQCEKICPLLNNHENKNIIAEDCFAVWTNNDIRIRSSSGGIFSVLAEEILDRNGYVCGAAYGKNFKVEHIIISKKEDLDKLRRSKYVQSSIGKVFCKIKTLLVQNKEVMFVGTPCQVAGLKAFLGRAYCNLLLVDIYCNYTPSPIVFDKYLNENYNIKDVEKIDFRVKKYGWIADIHTITYTDGKIEEKREYNDAFQRGYHPKLFMRETCEQCKFAGNPRQGDLSIADFWYIKDFYPELDDKKGTSCVVINNEHGNKFFETIKSKLLMCQKVSIDCMQYNRGAITKAHVARDRFFQLIKWKTFNESVDYTLNGKYDVAIWGNWSEKNYGSELTYYALYKVICTLGLDPLMVERPRNATWAPNEAPALFHKSPYAANAIHELYPDKVSMYELNQKSNVFIVGSDQIWHRNLYYDFGSVAFLDYIYNDKKKIAYASSFGREYWTGSAIETQEAAFYLKDFDYISVREQSGVSICENYFDVKAECVLDPVFLCDKENYIRLAEEVKESSKGNYIGGYILDIDKFKIKILHKLQKELGIKCNLLTDAFRDIQLDACELNIKQNAFCEEWLNNIIYSEFVITDSFHGMCFAIIFNKPFIAICNEDRGSIRFIDLLKKLGLSDRLISADDQISMVSHLLNTAIDYSSVNAVLEKERFRSLRWLQNAISAPKTYQMTEYDILQRKIQNTETSTNELAKKMPYIESELGNRKWDISVHRKELNEHKQLLGERLWDIQVHRNELDEHKEQLTQLIHNQLEMEKMINRIENYWIIRAWKKISCIIRKLRRE